MLPPTGLRNVHTSFLRMSDMSLTMLSFWMILMDSWKLTNFLSDKPNKGGWRSQNMLVCFCGMHHHCVQQKCLISQRPCLFLRKQCTKDIALQAPTSASVAATSKHASSLQHRIHVTSNYCSIHPTDSYLAMMSPDKSDNHWVKHYKHHKTHLQKTENWELFPCFL